MQTTIAMGRAAGSDKKVGYCVFLFSFHISILITNNL
jgi:hypothetical protein